MNESNAERGSRASDASEIAAAALAVAAAAAAADKTISAEESMDLDSGPGGLIRLVFLLLFFEVLGLVIGYEAAYNALPFSLSVSIYTANTIFLRRA